MRTSICKELFCDGLVSHPGGVSDSHLFNTTETRDTVSFGSVDRLARKGYSYKRILKKQIKKKLEARQSFFKILYKMIIIDHSK